MIKMLNGLLNVLFSVRLLPIFVTMVMFLLSIMSHDDLNKYLSNIDETIVLIYSFFLALIVFYLLSGLSEDQTLTKASLLFILLSVLMFNAVRNWELDKILGNISNRPHIAALAASPLLIIPLITLVFLPPDKKFGASGLGMLFVAIVGALIIGLNSDMIISGPTEKKSKLYRLLFGIIMASLCLLTYMFLWVRHTGQYEKQAVVFWFLTAVATIIIREYDALKNSDIPDWIWFMSISLTTFMASYLLYVNPYQGDFTQYNAAVMTVSLLSFFVIYFLKMTQQYDSDRLAMSEIVWIWLLSFVNLTVIDGYIKYVALQKRASLQFDNIAKTVVSLPIITNVFLSIYTTQQALKRSTSLDGEEIGTRKLVWLSAGTYMAAILSYLLNVVDIENKMIIELLENMEHQIA
tara:strand:- start:7049 stop:8269 length:1221 start_codon:yes stop_codon:yes gene_type:complete